MLRGFRVPELRELLAYFNTPKTGRKQDLIERAIRLLLSSGNRGVRLKIKEIHDLRNNIYQNSNNNIIPNNIIPNAYTQQSSNNNYQAVNNNLGNPPMGWYVGEYSNNNTSHNHRLSSNFNSSTASKLDFKSMKITPFHEPLESISPTFSLGNISILGHTNILIEANHKNEVKCHLESFSKSLSYTLILI